MWEDAILQEVRATRHALALECGNDLALICERLKAIEQEYQDRVGLPLPRTGDERSRPAAPARESA